MEHLSNHHEDHPNQHKNSHKPRNEMGHPVLSLMESQEFPNGKKTIVEKFYHLKKEIIQKRWTFRATNRDLSKKVN